MGGIEQSMQVATAPPGVDREADVEGPGDPLEIGDRHRIGQTALRARDAGLADTATGRQLVLGEVEMRAHGTEDAADPTEIHAPQHGEERLAAGYSRLTGG
jgi:hypothetical protein